MGRNNNLTDNKAVVRELAERFERLQAGQAGRGDALMHLARIVDGTMTVEQVDDILMDEHGIYNDARIAGEWDSEEIAYAYGYVGAWQKLQNFLEGY